MQAGTAPSTTPTASLSPALANASAALKRPSASFRLLWTEERADFDGRYYQLRNAPFQPKPIQKPHPPILVGGAGEKLTLPLVARVADDWNWNITGTPEDYRRKLNVLHAHCHKAGRDPSEISLSLNMDFLISEDPKRIASALSVNTKSAGISIEEAQKNILAGNPDQVRQRLQEFINLGVTTFMFSLRAPFDEAGTAALPDLPDRALRYHTTMDDVRRMAKEVLPPLRRKLSQSQQGAN